MISDTFKLLNLFRGEIGTGNYFETYNISPIKDTYVSLKLGSI